MSSLARIIEENLPLEDVSTTSYTDAVDLNGADKFSVQIIVVDGDAVAHLEGCNSSYPPNDDTVWTEIDSQSVGADDNYIFEQPNVAYRWARIGLEKDDVTNPSSDNLFLVIGDAI